MFLLCSLVLKRSNDLKIKYILITVQTLHTNIYTSTINTYVNTVNT